MMLGLSILFPILPYYARELKLTEFEAGILSSIYALTSVLLAPFWGKLSDRKGRKLPLGLGLLGFSLGFFAFGRGTNFTELFLARLFSGVFGSATLPNVMALGADLSKPDERSRTMGWIGASIGLGILLGPALGGFFAHLYGVRFPFFLTAGIGALSVLTVFFLPSPQKIPSLTRRSTTSKMDPRLVPFLLFGFLASVSQTSFEATLGFFLWDRFSRGPLTAGIFLGALGLVGALLQGGGIQLLSRIFLDLSLLRWGTVLIALGLFGMGWSPTLLFLFLSGILFAVGNALSRPTYTAILSRMGEYAQGEVQGWGQSAQSLGRAFGPLLATFLYQHAGPSIPYLGTGLITLLSLALLRPDTDPSLRTYPLGHTPPSEGKGF
jgi:MFS family permease